MKSFYNRMGRVVAWLSLAALVACGGSATVPVHGDWLNSFVEARQTATQQNRPILIAFVGSDWSVPSQDAMKDVLDTPTFVDYASSNLVLVQADFPRYTKLPPEIVSQNEQLAKPSQLDRLPMFVLVTSSGSIFGRIAGYPVGGPVPFVNQIKADIAQRR